MKAHVDEKILQQFPLKLTYFLTTWVTIDWNVKVLRQGPLPFLEEMCIYLKKTIYGIREIRKTLSITLSYLTYREICEHIMKI